MTLAFGSLGLADNKFLVTVVDGRDVLLASRNALGHLSNSLLGEFNRDTFTNQTFINKCLQGLAEAFTVRFLVPKTLDTTTLSMDVKP